MINSKDLINWLKSQKSQFKPKYINLFYDRIISKVKSMIKKPKQASNQYPD